VWVNVPKVGYGGVGEATSPGDQSQRRTLRQYTRKSWPNASLPLQRRRNDRFGWKDTLRTTEYASSGIRGHPVAMPARCIPSVLVAFALSSCGQHAEHGNTGSLAAKQAEVVERGRSVMPFDINRTMHHFQELPSGGVQQVLSTDGDPHQIALIRQHLQTEVVRFQHGNFSDPSAIHGPEMPGLRALDAGATRNKIGYSELPQGAQVTYATTDPTLVAAIHTWFDAQVREHGHHAMAM